jgi:hypothetical protein
MAMSTYRKKVLGEGGVPSGDKGQGKRDGTVDYQLEAISPNPSLSSDWTRNSICPQARNYSSDTNQFNGPEG